MRAQYSMSALVILLVIGTINCAKLNLVKYEVIHFLQDVRRQHHYDQLVLAHNRNATLTAAFGKTFGACKSDWANILNSPNILLKPCEMDYESHFVRNLMSELLVPVVLMNEFSNFVLKQHFSAAHMIVIYLDDSLASQMTLLRAMVAALKHRTQSNILFLIKNEGAIGQCDELYLRKLFEFCWLNKMINVVAICSDYKLSAQFYSYTHFPDFALEQKSFTTQLINKGPIYPNRLRNMHGYKLSYIVGGSAPRVIVYDWYGRKKLGGFAGHFLRSFARKHNFQLHEPLPPPSYTAFAPAQDLIAAVRNNTVDISIALTFPSIPFTGFTYPYEQPNWCIWMPIEADVPRTDFIWMVFKGYTFVMTLSAIVIISFVLSVTLCWYGYRPDIPRFIIHDACLRGVLGQCFRELPNAPHLIRFVYLQIYVLGILLTTTYNSHFATYWTSAPKELPLRTFDDILHSKSRIYVFEPEYNESIGRAEAWLKYAPMFEIESDYHNYLRMRDSFDTKSMYIIPTTKWYIFREQQKSFTRPIFQMRHDLCFYYNIPLCFPVHENSIFMAQLHLMMLEADQSGLTRHWMVMGFLELIRSGRLDLMDLSSQNEFRPMIVEDMKIVLIGSEIALGISVFVFLMEIIYYRRERVYSMFRKRRAYRAR